MLYRLKNCNFTGFLLIAALTVFLSLGAASSYAEDISLSEVPQAVRASIEHETKGFEIDDIEREKDDGKIVYEVDAENETGQMKLKIAADGTLLEKDQEMDSDTLPRAVFDAVKKEFGDVYFGDIEKRYRRGRTYYKIDAQTDRLEIELEIAEDGKILDKETDRKEDDDDLDEKFRDARRVFMQLRCQLKIAAIGDSRVRWGVDPQYFLGKQNRKYPMAMNFGSGVKSVHMAKLMIEDYFMHAPNLEWVVYGMSPRIFNRYYRPDTGDDIRRNNLYKQDQAQWSTISNAQSTLIAAAEVENDDSPWGFSASDTVGDDLEDEDDRREALDDLRGGRYKFDLTRLEIFESTLQALVKHNIKMLAFSPLMHPITIGQPCTDDDGTPRKAYDEFVAKMRAFDKKYSKFYFLDVNNKGEHGFVHKEFRNLDHVNTTGAKKLTLILNDFMKKVDAGTLAGIQNLHGRDKK